MSYHTVIIGAGLSGLAAGIRLAYYEKKVCLLERHTTIGGLNSFYRLRNRNHDVGLHAVTNYAPPGTKTGALSKVLRQLRFRWEDFDLSPQLGSRVVFPGCALRFTNDFAVLRDEITAAFPQQADGFRRLIGRIEEHPIDALAPCGVSARAVVHECLNDPLLVDMLFCPILFYGGPKPHDMDFSQFCIMFRSLFFEGFGRPYEGVRRLMKLLVRKFREVGGELRLRAGVREILRRGRRTVGVVLDNGEEVEAENVVSSAGAVETLRLCGLADEEMRIRPGELSFVETIFSLDRQPSELGVSDTIVFYNDSDSFRYEPPREPVDVRSGIICSPNNFHYAQPLDEGRVRITALANPAYWLSLPEDEYREQKRRWCDRMLESAVRFIPDFRPAIVDADMFTPRTIKHYTGHDNGCVYGSGEKLSDGRTHLENLFVCGNDQGMLGIIGTLMSGITVVNTYLLK